MKRHPDLMTATGRVIYYDDIHSLDVNLEDIKIGSSNICRYVGHLNWKLIEHLTLCSLLAKHHLTTGCISNPLTVPYSCIHDMHEIYVQDIPHGLKKYIPDYCKIETEVETKVHKALGWDIVFRPIFEVKFIDMRALVCEMTLLDHPAARICAEIYGGAPTSEERELFFKVSLGWTRQQQWLEVSRDIVPSEYYLNLMREPLNG